MAGPSFSRLNVGSASDQHARLEAAREELRALSPERFSELLAFSRGEGRPLDGRVDVQPAVPQQGRLARLVRLAGRAFSRLTSVFHIGGSGSASSAASEDPAIVERREALQRHNLSALAALDIADQQAVIREESGSERRIFEDLNQYIERAPAGEREPRQNVQQRIRFFLRAPENNRLDLSGLAISQLPDSLSHLARLKTLDLNYCTNLQTLEGMPELPALMHLNLEGCTNLQTLQGLPALPALMHLYLEGCTNLQTLQGMPELPALTSLDLSYCTNLLTLQGMPELPALTTLRLFGCTRLQTLQGLPVLPALRELALFGCTDLQTLEGLRERLPLGCAVNSPRHLVEHAPAAAPAQNPRVLQEESGSERRIFEDLNQYIERAPAGEREARRSVQERIMLFLRAPENNTLDLSGLAISQLPDSLSHLARLTSLNLSGCTSLQTLQGLPELPALTELDLSGWTNLQTLQGLPELPALTELHLSGCTNLQNLEGPPALPALTGLNLIGCTNLHNLQGLPALPALTLLSLSGCTNLQTLQGLPALPALTGLDLSGCTNLQTFEGLPELPALTALYLEDCTNLQTFEGMPELPALTALDLGYCTNLQTLQGLPALPDLTTLSLSGCTNLHNLQGMPALPALTRLSLNSCTNLHNLQGMPALPALTALYLGYCTNLQTLQGMPELPALRSLSLSDCTNLQTLQGLRERLPPGCVVDLPSHLVEHAPAAAPAQNPGVLQIARAVLQDNPKIVLASVAQHIERSPQEALQVRFAGEPGVDAGGLRKSLWTELGKILFGENDPNKLPATRAGVNEEKPEGDGWIPTVREAHSEEDRKNLIRLGRMISWGASRPDPSLLLAPIFSPDLFRALHAHAQNQEPLVVLRTLLHDRSLELLDKTDWNDDEWPVVQALAEMYLDLPEQNPKGYLAAHLSELKEAILAEPPNRGHLAMIAALAEGLELGAPGELDRLSRLSPAQIQERYQGGLDADRFIAALSCLEQSGLSALAAPTLGEQTRLELLNHRLEWLRNWITNPLGEIESPTVEQQAQCELLRRRLLSEITGRETLLDGEHVFLLIVGADEPPFFHTCFNRLDMPVSIATEEDFRAALTNLTAVRDQGYNQR